MPLVTGGAAGYAAPGPGKPASEDALLLVNLGEDRCVLAVADGLGGLPGAGEAARLAVACLAEAVEAGAAAGDSLRTAILDGFEAANRAILASGTGGATTLACAALENGSVRAFHVGDSEILLLGQRHRLRMRTLPHSPTGFAVEAGFLDDETALAHEERHIVSNVVGSRDMRIDIGSPVALRPLDTLLVGSDGLMDNLRIEEIAGLICTGPLGTAVARTAAAARDRMANQQTGAPSKPDDLTVLAYRQRPGKGFVASAVNAAT
jgi:serine/threonine protein phosphatase PrpC